MAMRAAADYSDSLPHLLRLHGGGAGNTCATMNEKMEGGKGGIATFEVRGQVQDRLRRRGR
eukprot:8015244-Prorocentrum_lima.AAC.1